MGTDCSAPCVPYNTTNSNSEVNIDISQTYRSNRNKSEENIRHRNEPTTTNTKPDARLTNANIHNTDPQYPCICGKNLIKITDASSSSLTVNYTCDQCQSKINKETVFWQCTQISHKHRNGFDICHKCIASYDPNIHIQKIAKQFTQNMRRRAKPSSDPVFIETIRAMHVNEVQSTLSIMDLMKSKPSNESYIVSVCDHPLIILIKFKSMIHIKSIIVHTMKKTVDEQKLSQLDISPAKEVYLYKLNDLQATFEDIIALEADHKITSRTSNALISNNISQKSPKFKAIQFMAMHITSNLGATSKTFINGFTIKKTNPLKFRLQTNKKVIKVQLHSNAKNQNRFQQTLESYENTPIKRNTSLLVQCSSNQDHEHNGCDLKECLRLQRIKQILSRYHAFIERNRDCFVVIDENNAIETVDDIKSGEPQVTAKSANIVLESGKAGQKVNMEDGDFVDKEVLTAFMSAVQGIDKLLIKPSTMMTPIDVDDSKSVVEEFDDKIEIPVESESNLDDVYYDNYNNCNLLDDFNHLLMFHEPQFENIYDEMLKDNPQSICSIEHCLMFRRNRRNRSLFNKNRSKLTNLYHNTETDGNYNMVQQQLLDTIHCHYYHTFDIGHRLRKNEIHDIEAELELKTQSANAYIYDNDCNDPCIKSIVDLNAKKTKLHSNITGSEHNSSSKFTTNVTRAADDLIYSKGIRYFYWKYYNQTNVEMRDPVTWMNRHNNQHSNEGYVLKDWYIKALFDDLKQELLNNNIYNMSQTQWNAMIIKADCHLNTQHMKCVKSRNSLMSLRCYTIAKDAPLALAHLIAIMVYCNETVLQRRFTETFRRMPHNECDASLIKRHQNYAHLGRLLRELVECFGEDKHYQDFKGMRLYHGITSQATFASSHICLKGPVSTSVDYNIALNFCANTGLIVELNLDQYWCFNPNASICGMAMFDCHLISDFPNEQERFFIGGFANFIIANIVIAPQAINYGAYIHGLNKLFHTITAYAESTSHYVASSEYDENTINAICYRMVSDELHSCYPNNEKYVEFKTIPKYIKALVHSHFVSVSSLCLFNKKDATIEQLMSLFFHDNGWINLDMIMTVFSSLKHITLKLTNNCSFVENYAMYTAVCYYIMTSGSERLESITIRIPKQNVSVEKVKNIAQRFQVRFKKLRYQLIVDDKLQSSLLGIGNMDRMSIVIKKDVSERARKVVELLQKQIQK